MWHLFVCFALICVPFDFSAFCEHFMNMLHFFPLTCFQLFVYQGGSSKTKIATQMSTLWLPGAAVGVSLEESVVAGGSPLVILFGVVHCRSVQ